MHTEPSAKRARPRSPAAHSQITGWQSDRRLAILLLDGLRKKAARRGASLAADAYWSAAYDIREILADRAAAVISESVSMYWWDHPHPRGAA
jgi:hypothetical protein